MIPKDKAERAELVEFVKAVLGEVDRATSHSAGSAVIRLLAPRSAYSGTPSIEVRYLLDGSYILGTYLVPIPAEVWAAISSPERNPYDNAEAVFRPTDAVAAPAPVILEGPGPSLELGVYTRTATTPTETLAVDRDV